MLPGIPVSYHTPHLGGNAPFSTQAPPASAAISSARVTAPARSASRVSNRTDPTGIASLSASESTAGEVDEPVRRQILAHDESSSARRDEFAMLYTHPDDSPYGDAEVTEPDEDAQDRRAERSSPKRRQPRESTPRDPALELAALATIRDASRAHGCLPLVSPTCPQKSSPESGTIDAIGGLSPRSTTLFFAGQGEPGSLSVSPASPTDACRQLPSPKRQLSAVASDFVPASFSSHLANPVSVAMAPPATELRSSQSSTGRRPLPPLPTAAPPRLATDSRGGRVPQLPRSDPGHRPYPALELIHPQPRRPLPATPMPMSSPSPSPSDGISRMFRDRPFARTSTEHEDSVNRSSLSLDDPLPEQYKPPRSVPRGGLVMTAVVPSDTQGAIASEFDPRKALLGRVTEASPARMGDHRALSALDTAFGRTLGSASRRGDHPPTTVVSAEMGSPSSFDKLLAEHFEGIQAKVLSESAETRAALALLADGLKAVTTKHDTFVAEIKDVLLAQHSSLIDLLRALSLHIDAIPQVVSTAFESDLREKVILDAVRPMSEALPTILEELHALRDLSEQRLPCAPLDDDLGTSASTLVKSVDLTEMLPAQPGARLGSDVVLVSDDALAQSDPKSHPTKARATIVGEKSAVQVRRHDLFFPERRKLTPDKCDLLQESRTSKPHGENKTLGVAPDAAVERENKLGERLRPYFPTDLSLRESPSPGSSEERLFAAANVSEDSDDEPTNCKASKDIFHGDVVPQYAFEEHAYTCGSDGWYSRREGEDVYAFL
jgi:hypothetical protein